MTAIMRLASAEYIIGKTLDEAEPASTSIAAHLIVDALERSGWRLVPARLPQLRHDVSGTPPLTEGQITSRQLIDCAAIFDGIDEEPFPAADFVAWVISETRGTPEMRWLEQRRLR